MPKYYLFRSVIRLIFLATALLSTEISWALECPQGFFPDNNQGIIWCTRRTPFENGQSQQIFRLNESNLNYFHTYIAPCKKQAYRENCENYYWSNWSMPSEGLKGPDPDFEKGRRKIDKACSPQDLNCAERAAADGDSQADLTLVGEEGSFQGGIPQQAEVDADRAQCEKQQSKASLCCNNPIQCISDLSSSTSESVAAIGSLAVATISELGAMGANQGIFENCQLLKSLSIGGAAANAALGGKCFYEKNNCENKCQQVAEKYERMIAECNNLNLKVAWMDSGGRGPHCPNSLVSEYRTVVATARGRKNRCTSYNANVAAMGQQAAHSAAASQFAELCENAATAQNTGFPNIDGKSVFSGDCSDPVNASNPICVKCRGAAAQYDPLCRGLTGQRGYRTGSEDPSAVQASDFGSRATADGSDFDVPTEEEQNQAAVFGGGSVDQARANAVSQNGGGFVGGSGGGGASFGGSSGGGSSQGAGYDTDIMKGVGGGGGYSASSVGVAPRSGYRGPSTGGGSQSEKSNQFDFKQYLPGGEKYARKDSRNGLATRKLSIGKAHQNIFDMVSRRYRIYCMKGLFIGCEKQKIKKRQYELGP